MVNVGFAFGKFFLAAGQSTNIGSMTQGKNLP
jgi:hypothetical protein